jgi:hypothetical protein|tara:strand:+ start:5209 stop:6006 length:798 start_codon:yes stop_codon:yes gene_type:complete
MATIPSGQKFHTVASTVDTENKGSAGLNAQRTIFTMQDIQDTVTAGGGVDGSGTANSLSRWLDSNTLQDAGVTDDGSTVAVARPLSVTGTVTSSVNLVGVDAVMSGNGTFSGNVTAVDMVASGNLLVGDNTGENPVGINVQQDKGNLAIGLLIHNQNTGADADAKISFETQSAADISIGIDRGDSNKFKISRSGNLGVNDEMSVDSSGVTANTAVTSATFNVSALETAPASASATGVAGDIRFATDAIYVCTATDTWKKVAIATF